MKLVNYHTHTYRCGHASGTEEDYVLFAISSNIKTLGFSDHGPFKDEDFGFRMNFDEFQNYLDTIESLKEKYSDKITIKSSVEIEYFKHKETYYEELLHSYNLDYLLLGQHMYLNKFNKITYLETSTILDYAKSLCDAMDSHLFKMVAHPDYFMQLPITFNHDCKIATEMIINSALKNDVILEFNANGIRKGL